MYWIGGTIVGMKNTIAGFKKFILRGNAVDLAIGVLIGAAFNSVVSSLVKGILTPLIGLVTRVPDFSNYAVTIEGSKFLYGDFLNNLISFVLTAAAAYFFVVVPMNTLVARMKNEKPADPQNKNCPECLFEIPIKATRCAHCTTKLEA